MCTGWSNLLKKVVLEARRGTSSKAARCMFRISAAKAQVILAKREQSRGESGPPKRRRAWLNRRAACTPCSTAERGIVTSATAALLVSGPSAVPAAGGFDGRGSRAPLLPTAVQPPIAVVDLAHAAVAVAVVVARIAFQLTLGVAPAGTLAANRVTLGDGRGGAVRAVKWYRN